MKNRGKLIVFEGLDGAGTTTQMKVLGEKLSENGRNAFVTHEPTDNPIGKLVRQALQKKIQVPSNSLALLYAADRDDHLYNKEYGLVKKLELGIDVITDRYFYSSIAYQSVECSEAFIRTINAFFPNPDILIFVDTSVDECLKRIDKRGEEKELFEKETYLTKVREKYLELLSTLPQSVSLIKIDGMKSIDQISNEITEKVVALIGE